MFEFQFPPNFLWGTATAGHQVEGNNTNTESWVLEQLPNTAYAEASGIACDHYNRYPEDIALLAELGFNAYRFSIEWARIEPEEGEFSQKELDHYRRMLARCHEHNMTPVVTFHHFTSPQWLHRYGGWLDKKTPERFARFCEKATAHLGDLIGVACTLNEPNIPIVLDHIMPFKPSEGAWWNSAAEAFGVAPDKMGLFQFVTDPRMRDVILESHRKAYDVLHAGPGDFPVGLTLAVHDFQAATDGEEMMTKYRHDIVDVYLEEMGAGDFVGVQNYARMVVGPYGIVPPDRDAEKTGMGEEFYPEALAGAVRHVAEKSGLPVYVTENGIAGEDDSRRVEYYQLALHGLAQCLQDNVDVRGYLAWSAMDNFEWTSGFSSKLGIISVDRETLERTPKASAYLLGKVASSNTVSIEDDLLQDRASKTKKADSLIPDTVKPYLLKDREGPHYLFGTQLATIIASAESSGNLFELVSLSGGQDDSFPAHRHTHTHEGIYVLDGLVEIRLDDHLYLLAPGDYAHIPAGTIHAYKMHSHNTRFLSVTSKGDISRLYSHIGFATDLHIHPPHGKSVDLAALLADAIEGVDLELINDDFAGGEAERVTNNTVPDGVEPYVIASGGGIHRVAGQDLYVLLATQKNTNGEFIVLHNEGPRGGAIIQHFHEQHTETFLCTGGRMTMWANGKVSQLQPGDFLHVPAGTIHSFRMEAHYTKFFSVLAPGLFEPFFHTLGSPYDGFIFPPSPGPARFDRLMAAVKEGELDLKIVGPPPDAE